MSTPKSTLILSGAEVARAMPHTRFNEFVDTVFKEWGGGGVVMPPKVNLDMARGGHGSWCNAMPAFVANHGAAGIKWIGGFPANPPRGMPYIRGVIVLTDPENGDTLAVMDGSYISDWRTGASAAVATRYLANPGPLAVAMVGAGGQGKTASVCLHQMFPDLRLTAVGRNAGRLERFRAEVADLCGLEARTTTDVEAACRDADVIVLLTTAKEPFIRRDWIRPGALALAMGSYPHLTDDALRLFDRIVVDSWGQAAHRGELKGPAEAGVITEKDIAAELGMVAAGLVEGRTRVDERVLGVLVGLGAHDVYAATQVYRAAKEQGLGMEVALGS